MKKILLITLIFTGLYGNSQTLTVSDTLAAGDTLSYFPIDTTGVPLLNATIGSGVTWDYSSIVMESGSAISKDSVIEISGSAYSADYPSATYHEKFEAGVQSFFSNIGTEMIVYGFVFELGGTSYIITYDTDPLINLQYPMSLNDNITDNISGHISGTVSGITLDTTISGSANVKADGTGTLLLGGNTYNDVIRVKTNENISGVVVYLGNNINVVVKRTSYLYFQPNGNTNLPLFRFEDIEVQSIGTTYLKSIWSKDISVPSTSGLTQENANLALNLFPNPAGEQVMVSTSENSISLTVFNTIGEMVYNKSNPNTKEIIALDQLTSGIYFVQIKNKYSTLTKKLVIK